MTPVEQPFGQPDAERIVRLEEQMRGALALLAEIRADQKDHAGRLDDLARLVAGASGGLRVLVLLGAIGAAWGTLRAFGVSVGGWLSAGAHH